MDSIGKGENLFPPTVIQCTTRNTGVRGMFVLMVEWPHDRLLTNLEAWKVTDVTRIGTKDEDSATQSDQYRDLQHGQIARIRHATC